MTASSRLASLSLLLALAAQAQTTFTDPANIRGERPNPRTGRELPVDQGTLGLQQMLRRLNTRASMMLIVAHPDDEDGGMLTFYSRGQGARVGTLTLTRGEGGQNAMTGDFEDALGLIRTQELLAADRYFGVDQMFGTEVDFGFSKTKEEAFSKWTHERVLYDAVRAVRLYRPLVIAAVFIGGVTDGHGQHQVSGEIAQEVFTAAADPKVFPELTAQGILPWAPLKVYARVPTFAITDKGLFDYATNQYGKPSFTNYVTGETTATPPSPDVVIHEGETDPLLTAASPNPADLPGADADSAAKLTYVQFARLGLGLQCTQIGPGVRLAGSGAYDVSYHRYGSRLPNQPQHEGSFFEGIDTSLRGIASLSSAPPPSLLPGLTRLGQELTGIAQAFNGRDPQKITTPLVEVQRQLGALLYSLEEASFPGKADVLHELRVKQAQLNDAIVLALGLQMTATADVASPDVVQGSPVKVTTSLTSHASEPVAVFAESLHGPDKPRTQDLLATDNDPLLRSAQPFEHQLQAEADLTSTPTRPYFGRDNIEQPVYQLRDPQLRNAPATPSPLVAWAVLRFHQTEVQLGRVVSVGAQSVAVVPPVSVSLPSHARVFAPSEKSLNVSVHVTPSQSTVKLEAPPGWSTTAGAQPADAETKQFRAQPLVPPQKPFTLQAVAATPQGTEQTEGYRAVGYGDLPRTNFYNAASLRVVPTDLKLPQRRRVAYVPGTGDAVADNLASVGIAVTNVSVAELTPQRLAQFDTVILGVRTYNAHPDLHGAPTQALFDYARNGGNVIVQYQTAEFTGADAPFPLNLGNAEKVVDEAAPVRLLTPEVGGTYASSPERSLSYAALSSPNHITGFDFTGWVEERGHGFLREWDPRYTALTETHDPGQEPQRGGLITTPLGRGNWTYCAFALYRQLPEAVPGSFRLLVNLLGLADEGKS